ncbi:MAG: alpha/beta hydrolase [Candidatus Yanofskybacteria bacterium]|nr:alpha/beta hydrolase [Candidatus Yanofskybacteria bacterium]
MKKGVFIIHGWDGYPEEGWFPWLKKELESRGFEVQVPAMPEPAVPKIEVWVSHLSKIVGDVNENTFFVGHSIGCQTILRYLESLPVDKKVGGTVFVSGWFVLGDLETEEEKIIGRPWIETPINFNLIKGLTNNFVAIFGDNDPVVPFEENKKLFEERLNTKIIIEHDKGHFSGSDGVTELPSALNAVLEMTGGLS